MSINVIVHPHPIKLISINIKNYEEVLKIILKNIKIRYPLPSIFY